MPPGIKSILSALLAGKKPLTSRTVHSILYTLGILSLMRASFGPVVDWSSSGQKREAT